jgi:exopolyphosphatase/guanosine-5'-triphosphate,3'-diphosphate pyrophosphatase
MKLFLVRHGRAAKRSEWSGKNEERPLTDDGRRQALGLVDLVEGQRIDRILTSPHRRCRQTVEPLALTRGLRLESDRRLAEGARPDKALELLDSLDSGRSLVCGHGDLLPGLLAELEGRGARLEGRPRFEKGSLWIVEGRRLETSQASYRPPCETPAHRRVAVLDLGSTSFHLLVADTTPEGDIERVVRQRKPLHLGAVIADGPRLPEEASARAVEAARRLREVAEEAGAEFLLPVATAAMREAENGVDLARILSDELGASVRILTGEEEARIIFAAFRARGLLAPGPNLGMDLGGGSLELAVGDVRGISWEITLRLGIARLFRELVTSDPMTPAEANAVRVRVRELLAPHRNSIQARTPACVATGGTVRALARLLAARGTHQPAALTGFVVRTGQIQKLAHELVGSTYEERRHTPGMRRDRAELLPTGALVLATALEELGLRGLRVCDWGLREGVLLEALGLGGDLWPH